MSFTGEFNFVKRSARVSFRSYYYPWGRDISSHGKIFFQSLNIMGIGFFLTFIFDLLQVVDGHGRPQRRSVAKMLRQRRDGQYIDIYKYLYYIGDYSARILKKSSENISFSAEI